MPRADKTLGRDKWRSSGITDEQAKKLHLTPLGKFETKALHSSFHQVQSLKIPYFDFNGKPTSFYRIRYLEDLPGFAGQSAKPQRYVQAPGSANEVYMPPLFTNPWAAVARAPTQRLLITEGELKAAAACGAGHYCIGLGGVDVWRSSRRQVSLLPQLQAIEWNERDVFIIFDSDAVTNPNVVRAQLALAKTLQGLGAMPYICSIPPGPDGEKQGLDDIIVRDGPNVIEWLLDEENASPLESAQELWKMNEEVILIRKPGFIIELNEDRTRMSFGDFKGGHFANRHYNEITFNNDGEPVSKKKPLAPAWIAWAGRHEARKVVYEPGKPMLTEDKCYNSWQGWGCEPKKGDVTPWRKLLDYIFRDHRDDRQWFERWCAYPIQNPGAKMFSSALFWGATQGTGKSLVGYTLMRIYGSNGTKITNRDIHTGANDWAENKQFVMGDEITSVEQKKSETELLKALISQEEMWINIKYVARYLIADRINYYFTSNHPDAFFIEDTDRRHFIVEMPPDPMPLQFYSEYDRWLNKDGGPSALFDYFLHLDMGDFSPTAPARETSSKKLMKLDTKNELASWIAGMKEDPASIMSLFGTAHAAQAQLLSSAQLLRLFDPEESTRYTAAAVARELKRAGYRQVLEGQPVMTSKGAMRLFAIREPLYWRNINKHATVVEHWNSCFGPRPKKHSGGK